MKTLTKYVSIIPIALIICLLCMTGCISNYHIRSYDEYADWLKLDNEFNSGLKLTDSVLDYDFDNESFADLRAKYGLIEAAGSGNTLEKAINLSDWLSKNVKISETVAPVEEENALNLLNFSFQSSERGVNARQYVLIANESLRALGIKSRAINLMPKEPEALSSHYAVQFYADELSKWVMIDPVYNYYFKDETGNYMDCFELRDALANKKAIDFGENLTIDGVPIDGEKLMWYKTFLARNCYWFVSVVKTGRDRVHCAPNGMNIRKWYIKQSDASFSNNFISKEEHAQMIAMYKNINIICVSKNVFLKV